jgi:hypothetical protein
MPEVRWKSFAEVSPEREYLALTSHLRLKRYRTIPRFLGFSREIETQLRESKGLVGYSLRAHLFSRRFLTLSLWEGEQALGEFVRKIPHGRVMTALLPHMDEPKFVRWKFSGSGIPPSWDEGLKQLEAG